MWLRVDSSIPSSQLQHHVFTTIQDAVSAARFDPEFTSLTEVDF
jgi:hypothetical protein